MDNNNWRAAQGQVQIPGQFMGAEAVAAEGVEGGDWRTQLQPDARHRIVNKIIETLKRHLPFSGQEGLQELKKIAVRLEEKIYAAATSQSDYLRRITLKMLTMETKSQNPMTNSLQSNGVSSTNPQDPGLTSALPHGGGMSQGTMCNVPGMNPSMRNMSNVNQNAVGNSLGQSVPSNIHANSQRQIQASLDLSQTSNVSGGDWQEEIYLKIKSMNEMYSPELNEMYQRVAAKLQQHDAYPQQPKNEQLEDLRSFKVMSEHLIALLQTKKQDIQPHHNQEIAVASEVLANIQKQAAMMSLQEMNIN